MGEKEEKKFQMVKKGKIQLIKTGGQEVGNYSHYFHIFNNFNKMIK